MRISLLTCFLLFACAIQAQDKLSLRSGEILTVKVVEFGVSEIKYKHYPLADESPIYVIEKSVVARIELATGEIFTYSADPFSNSTLYANQKKRALKINFFSPLNATTMIGFEQALKPGRTFEVEVGFIGLGWDVQGNNPVGGVARFGYKFMRSPDFYASGMRYAHALKGGYFKPEIILTSYNIDSFSYEPWGIGFTTERVNKTGMAVVLNFGKQWVFDDVFLVDVFVGVGYGAMLNGREYAYDFIEYGFIGADQSMPLALNGGMRIGFLIK